MIINHNLGAMNANRNMGINQANASKSMEKLSSGLKINRAGDDAAGLAISEKMRGQIRGLDQASANAQDGISMIQTAEGALSETHSILQRMRELAVQSANDTNVAVDRGEIQKEMDQLAKEVTRISNNTEFNTQKLINGGISDSGIKSATFHVGANAGQGITLSINAMDAKSLGIVRDVSQASVDTDNNAAKISTVSADSVDVTKTLADGKYNVELTALDAGATSVTDATGTAVTGLVSGTATADTNITLTYTDHGTAATNTAGTALASGVADMSTATSIKVNGTTVNLNSVKALGSLTNAQTSEDSIVTALQTDLDTALGSGKYTVSVDAGTDKLTITSVATGAGTKVDLTGSDSASATLLGFTGAVVGTNGEATGGVKDWVATGSLGGVVSAVNNTVNGLTIDQTELSTTAAVGDKITVIGFKDATLSAQLQSVSAEATTTATLDDATITETAADATVTGTATANTNVTLTYAAEILATAGTVVGGSVTAPTTVVSGLAATAQLVITVDGTAHTIGDVALKAAAGVGKTDADLIGAINTSIGAAGTASIVGGKIQIVSATTGDTSNVSVGFGTSIPADAALLATTFGFAGTETDSGTDLVAAAWNATGDLTGEISATNNTINGLTINTANIDDTLAVGGETVTISATVTAAGTDIGNKVTIDQKNGGSYVIGDAAGAGQMKVGITSGTAVEGTSTVNITTAAATAASKQADGTMSDATVVAGLDVSTQAKASAAVTTLQTAIEKVSSERSKLGSYQNRLEHTIANLGTSSENLTSAESRIRDVNMAKEMSAFSKNNILSQAAQAMLAQANQQPQQVLQLLR